MLLKKRKNEPYIDILNNNINMDNMHNLKSAKLIYINGKGALSVSKNRTHNACLENRTISKIKLNNIPLIQINAPDCPTCESIISTGYGIEKAECKELKSISDKINSDFISLDKTIDDLQPLLLLLESGLYIIADTTCYPTDGAGNFFWNVPDKPVKSQATVVSNIPETFKSITCFPSFLYPTQCTDCYNEQRVKYYTNRFNEDDYHLPRAIVYNFSESISFVIDGHHKACAAALTGKPLRCIMIIPYTGKSYNYDTKEFSNIQFGKINIPSQQIPFKYRPKLKNCKRQFQIKSKITTGHICNRKWENEYLNSVKLYPSLEEYSYIISSNLSITDITDELIEKYINLIDDDSQQNLKTILYILKYEKDKRLKSTAITCAQIKLYCSAKNLAFKLLLNMKNDKDVEQFFIDYIINCDDNNDPLLSAAKSFWD